MTRLNKKLLLVIGAVLGVGCIVTILVFDNTAHAPQPADGVCIPKSLQITDSACILLEYAKTETSQAKGLSGRDGMPQDRGMIFEFNDSALRCFWMKDMRFPIDIVWLDADAKILAKEINVNPSTYPNNFCPDVQARYVVEVNAGLAEGWAIGTQVPL